MRKVTTPHCDTI